MLLFIPYLLFVCFCQSLAGIATERSRTVHSDTNTFIFETDERPILNENSVTQAASYGNNFTSTEKFSKNHAIYRIWYFVNNNFTCIAVLLVLLFILYTTCIFILTNLGKPCYKIYLSGIF